MEHYIIRDYQAGFEQDQARIGLDVARNWIWPYAYHVEGLMKHHTQADFDPDTRHYCFLGEAMVGYMFSIITPSSEIDTVSTAVVEFPRMMPGHEQAARLLLEKAFETLKKKGISRVTGRVTTMCPGDVRLAEQTGFRVYDWGYKIYYSYETGWGKLIDTVDTVEAADPEKDLGEYAKVAAKWYKRPVEWCYAHLKEWHEEGVIAHIGVRKQGRMVAACLAAPNDVRSSTAAIYYAYSPDERCLRPMLVQVVNKCVDYAVVDVIADLVNENRQYESVYQDIGFRKVAEWARCEKILP